MFNAIFIWYLRANNWIRDKILRSDRRVSKVCPLTVLREARRKKRKENAWYLKSGERSTVKKFLHKFVTVREMIYTRALKSRRIISFHLSETNLGVATTPCSPLNKLPKKKERKKRKTGRADKPTVSKKKKKKKKRKDLHLSQFTLHQQKSLLQLDTQAIKVSTLPVQLPPRHRSHRRRTGGP